MSGYASVVLLPGGIIHHAVWASSHKRVIRALRLPNSGGGCERCYLCAGAPDGDMARYYADEDDPNHLPAWYTEHEAEYLEKMIKFLERMNALRARREALDDDYDNKYNALEANYDNKYDALEAECESRDIILRADRAAKYSPPINDYQAWSDVLEAKIGGQRAVPNLLVRYDILKAEYKAQRAELDADYLAECDAMRIEYLSLPGAVNP